MKIIGAVMFCFGSFAISLMLFVLPSNPDRSELLIAMCFLAMTGAIFFLAYYINEKLRRILQIIEKIENWGKEK